MKAFVITGASDGIGAEIACQLAAAHRAEGGLATGMVEDLALAALKSEVRPR